MQFCKFSNIKITDSTQRSNTDTEITLPSAPVPMIPSKTPDSVFGSGERTHDSAAAFSGRPKQCHFGRLPRGAGPGHGPATLGIKQAQAVIRTLGPGQSHVLIAQSLHDHGDSLRWLRTRGSESGPSGWHAVMHKIEFLQARTRPRVRLPSRATDPASEFPARFNFHGSASNSSMIHSE